MFLNFLQKHNPGLIDFGVYLLEHGRIEPDTYVIDLDSIEENADRLSFIAKKTNVKYYFMTKQTGRNPEIAKRVLGAPGFTGLVAVDFREALSLHSQGLPVKHLGHLCQIPQRSRDSALDMNPEVITVFSAEKAGELSEAARRRNTVQDILLRIRDDGDIFYSSQEGGFALGTLGKTLDSFAGLSGVRIAGVTSFPCFLFDREKRKSTPTHNAETLVRAAAFLRNNGFNVTQINMPSCNSPATIPLAAQMGATHLEPGHSLTGTNPDNPEEREPLKPALLYMTEVSHQYEGSSFSFGGGYYRRGSLSNALVKDSGVYRACSVSPPDPQAIDYHFKLQGNFPSGAPVCMSFRTQIFTTRSRVALVEHLSKSKPVLHSIWDSSGNLIAPESLSTRENRT